MACLEEGGGVRLREEKMVWREEKVDKDVCAHLNSVFQQ